MRREVEEIKVSTGAQRRRVSVIAAVGAIVLLAAFIAAKLFTPGVAGSSQAAVQEAGCRSAGPRLSVLLVGNSYTYENDLPAMLANVMCKSAIADNVSVQELASGSATMRRWVDNHAEREFSGHDIVVLQEQSQIPGFYGSGTLYPDSRSAIDDLARAATNTHAQVVLFETWGRRDGDLTNQVLYPNYDTMQARISTGYGEYLATVRSNAAPNAQIAAVGHAWFWVHGHKPQLFTQLYASDGSHPSIAGTYLAALVLAQTLSHHELPARLWKPKQVRIAQASALQAAARAT